MKDSLFHWKVLGLGFMTVLLLLPGLGSLSSVMNSMEYVYSVPVPLEMHEHANWLLPLLEGEPSIYKPPLLWWMILVSYKSLGVSLLSMRLPAVISTAGTVMTTACLGSVLGLEPPGALAAALMTLGSLGLFGTSRMALIDLPLTFFMVLAFYGLCRCFIKREKPWLYVCGAASGCSMMLKWPVAPAVIGPALLAWILWEKDRDLVKGMRRYWLGAFYLALVLAIPWNVVMTWHYSTDFLRTLFYEQLFRDRFVTGQHVPLLVFLWMCLLATAPWTLIFFGVIFSSRKKLLSSREDRLLLIWVLASFLPFVIQKIKTERYILFAIPALAIWTLRHFDMSILWHKLAARLTSALILLVAVGVCGLGLWFHLGIWASGLSLVCGVMAAWGLWNQGNLVLAGGGFSGVLLVVLGLFLPQLGPGDFPVQETLRSIPGPVSIFCRSHDMAYLPVVAGKNLWNFFTEKNLNNSGDLSLLRLSLSRGHSLATCEEDLPKLKAFLEAVGGATYQTQVQWPSIALSHARLDQIKKAFRERNLKILERQRYILSHFHSLGAFLPQGYVVKNPLSEFPMEKGAYLVYLTIDCPGGIQKASGVNAVGWAVLLSRKRQPMPGGAIFKRDFLRSTPCCLVWPLLLQESEMLELSFGTYPGNPHLIVRSLRLQSAAKSAIEKLVK